MKKIDTPLFENERQEADWWFANQAVIADAFEEEHGIPNQGALAEKYAEEHAAEILALVMDEGDVETALERAAEKGISPREYVRQLLHTAFEQQLAA